MIEESTIRERAFALWEKDACPEGAAKFYWYLAREQLEAQARPKKPNIYIAEDPGAECEKHQILVALAKSHEDVTYSNTL